MTSGRNSNKTNRLSKIILRSLLSHKARTLITFASVVLSVALEVLPPLILASAIDSLASGAAVSFMLAGGYFALLACSGLAGALREAMIVATGESITHSLRSAMMEKLQRLPAEYFTEHESGQTASIQVNDVDAIEDMFSSGIISMFSDLGTVLSMLAVVFTKSLGLGILLAVALPLLSLFTLRVQKKMLAAHTENRKALAQASGIIPETLKIIRSLHVFHAESFAEKRYSRAVKKSFLAIEKTNFYDAIYSPVILTVSAAIIAVMMSLSGLGGAFQAFFGISVGTAVALISYVNSIFTPLASIGMEIQAVQSAAAGFKRVQAFLNEKERKMPPDGNTKASNQNIQEDAPEKHTAEIEIRHLSFGYDKERPVLKDFSLEVKKGEFVTLTGRTGAGKSTLFKILLGLYEPDSGEVLVCGENPINLDGLSRRKTLCCVEQKVTPVLCGGRKITVRDQITLGNPEFTDKEIWSALEVAELKDTVMSLPEKLGAVYSDSIFSQGQKQLLMIARAVVSNPKVLLLDEITAGLDSSTEQLVMEALKKAAKGRTVLSISHRLSKVMDGRIVRLGS